MSPGAVIPRIRGFGERRRVPIIVLGSVGAAAIIARLLAGHRDEFRTAITGTALWLLGLAAVLQLVALLVRTEAWHLCISAAGGRVKRRIVYRASSLGVLGSFVQGQFAVVARIAALRKSSPEVAPQVPTLIAAEFPILAVEASLAALTSFTLVGPLGLPWWLPLLFVAVIGSIGLLMRRLAVRKGRELWRGLAVVRRPREGSQLIGLVLIAVIAQIFRNWLLLHAVGIDASLFDAIAVLIAVVTLGTLPVGPSVGAAAAVLILGSAGVAATAAAGVLLTVTGIAGGLCFAVWAAGDWLWARGLRPNVRVPAPTTTT
jgi:uncharacterized membrane protein YbhN (UPF0104 family)